MARSAGARRLLLLSLGPILGVACPGTPPASPAKPVPVAAPNLPLGAPKAMGEDPVVVAVGDLACDADEPAFLGNASACRMRATHALAAAVDPVAVLLLGDIQYPVGAADAFGRSFHPIWGDLKPRMRPSPGNHEYGTPGAAGYFGYFGAAAGEPGKGYYSFDLGAWHLVSLNSNCAQAGGCGVGSPQHTWLQADLAGHRGGCTAAFWHHPRFSSGPHGNDASTRDLWEALARSGAELILTGHDHHYERFAPQSASGVADPLGPREFVVGIGGKSLYPERRVQPNSEARFHKAFGVLKLTLRPTGYDWQLLLEPGQPFADAGSGECH